MSGAIVALLPACALPSFIPASLQTQVDRSLTFSQLKDSPDSYRGRLLVLGGEVLTAKRLKDGTRIEVLQLPLDGSQRPEWDRTASEGRFVALQRGFLDPATLPEGTRVTLVGEVTGVITLPLDETEYAYPTLEIKTLKVWPDSTAAQDGFPTYRRSLWGPYWGGAYWGNP
jgi:outer membrane lipoprotein